MLPNAQTSPVNTRVLIQKIQSLPPERVIEVDDFVEFLRLRGQREHTQAQDRALTRMTARASEASFADVWDNAEDEAYDAL